MKEPIWLTKQQILVLHAEQMQEHGGSHGVRDNELLESALGKPQNLYHYTEPTIFELAASFRLKIADALVSRVPFSY